MESNIISGVVRAVAPAVIGFLVGKGILPAGDYAPVVAAIAALVAASWSVKSNLPSTIEKEVAKKALFPTSSNK